MRKKTNSGGLIKGVPTAVLVSALIHGAVILIAGGMVVFSVVKKMEKKFEPPPPVERPKMQLKKPQVKVRKRARPKVSQRITSKRVQSMTSLQLPEIAGMADGLGGGVGGFELMPDPADLGLFGGRKSIAIGNDFEGTFYSMEMTRSGEFAPIGVDKMNDVVERFVESGWNPVIFSPYYRAPHKLYTTHFMIPPIPSEHGPAQFGIELSEQVSPAFWVLHYKGKIAHPEGGRFRFRGTGDNFFIVRVNKKIVLATGFGQFFAGQTGWRMSQRWSPTHEDSGRFLMGHGWCTIGDWFELEPGVPVEMETICGDYWGGWFKAMLVVEKHGEYYPKNEDGMPILPVFRTAEIPERIKNEMEYLLIPGEVNLNGDLMFNVY
jgi:hypothetical protein